MRRSIRGSRISSLRYFATLLCTVGLCALRADLASADQAVRVMTFNVRYANPQDGDDRWDLRKDLVIDVIRDFGPDVLGLQEPLPIQMEFLENELNDYQLVGCGRDDGKRAGEFTAMMIRKSRFETVAGGRFWFCDSPEVAGSMGWGADLPRLCVWARLRDRNQPRRECMVYNTHFDHRSHESREKAGALIATHIAKKSAGLPVLVMGDFNTTLESRPLQLLTQADVPLLDTWNRSEEASGTFNGFRGRTGGPKIDFVFSSSHWRTESGEIVRSHHEGRYPSDHFPVTAVLNWGGAAAESSSRE